MKAYFDNDGGLVVSAQDNTEKVALDYWWSIFQVVDLDNDAKQSSCLKIESDAHLKTKIDDGVLCLKCYLMTDIDTSHGNIKINFDNVFDDSFIADVIVPAIQSAIDDADSIIKK